MLAVLHPTLCFLLVTVAAPLRDGGAPRLALTVARKSARHAHAHAHVMAV
jgi:hypothetical protein